MSLPIPTPPTNILFGHLLKLRQAPIDYLSSVISSMGDVVKFRLGFFEKIFLSHPDYAKQILVEHHLRFDKGSREWAKMKLFFGKGILTTNGSTWAHQRRTLQPEFRLNQIPKFGEPILEESRALADRWEKHAQENKPIHLHEEMLYLTLRIITRAMFSENIDEDKINRVHQNLSIILQYGWESSTRLFDLPVWFPTLSNRRVVQARKNLNDLVLGMIVQRKKNGAVCEDLLSRLLMAKDPETGEKMEDEEIRDHLMAVLLAGHETTAISLAFTCMLLCQYQEQQEKIYQEIINQLHGQPLQIQHWKSFSVIYQTIQESMRLYPPIWAIFRRNVDSISFGGHTIPAKKSLFIFVYYLHRHPEFWEHPSSFIPERFNEENTRKRHPYAYLPFGAGPHVCIGRELAMFEMPLVLAALFQRFQMRLAPDFKLELQLSLTMRSKNPLFVFLERRK